MGTSSPERSQKVVAFVSLLVCWLCSFVILLFLLAWLDCRLQFCFASLFLIGWVVGCWSVCSFAYQIYEKKGRRSRGRRKKIKVIHNFVETFKRVKDWNGVKDGEG